MMENQSGRMEGLPTLGGFISPANVAHYKTADDALRAYAEQTLTQMSGGKAMIHRDAAFKQLLATLVAAVVMFIDIGAMMVYHRNYPVFLGILLAAVVALIIAHRRLNSSAALVGKMAAMPDADVQAVLVSEYDSMVPALWVTLGKAAMLVAVAVGIAALFNQPHMIFEDNATGCGVRFYTMAFSPVADVVVPDVHDGKPVTEIRGNVFQSLGSIHTVTLPKGLTQIRGYTFEGCGNLESIVIPEGVTRIGGHAFYGCGRLSEVTFPSTLKEIGSSAFRQCYRLTNARIPQGCSVNSRAFKESPTRVERY